MKDNGCIYYILGIFFMLIITYINFQFPFIHLILIGILLLVILFFVVIGIGAIYEYFKEEKIKSKAKKIIANNPHGYTAYIKEHQNIGNNLLKIIEAKSEIEVYEKNSFIVSMWEKWSENQVVFSKSCRNLFQNKNNYGYYHYQFKSHQSDYSGADKVVEHSLWHFFIYSYSSYIKSETFEQKHFRFILNNNKAVTSIKTKQTPLSSYSIESLIDILNIICSKYPHLLVLFLLPEELNKQVFYDKYYRHIEESLPSLDLQLLIDYNAECKNYKKKNVLLLDLYTNENRQIRVAEQIISSCGYEAPQMVYLSIYKEYSNEELKTILKNKRDIIEKKGAIKSLIDQGLDHIKETQIEKAEEEFKEAQKEIESSKFAPDETKELMEHLEGTKEKARTKYSNIETFESWNEQIIVEYDTPFEFIQPNNYYAFAKFPQKGCHVYPYRRGKKKFLVGHQEKAFSQTLSDLLPRPLIKINNDIALIISEKNKRELDISLSIENHPSIKIDIEIDEPYEAGNRKPIHYITSGDNIRDDELVRRGWIIVRFAEKQVKQYPKRCALYISQLIKAILPEFEIPSELEKIGELPHVKRWTFNEALQMAAKYEREQYLGIQFSKNIEEKIVYANYTLSESERRCNNLIEKPEEDSEFTEKMRSFTEADRFERDKHIGFNAIEHIYINKTNEEHFLPVSSLIAYFFEDFDALSQAEKQWERYGIPIEESLLKWDRIGKLASEVGTFVHLQTENFFKKGFFDSSYQFKYGGCSEIISIETEMKYFQQFVKDYNIKPYRQEWPIFDEELNIAGTIDLICQTDADTFIIYDWKRSGKVVNNQGQPNIIAYGGKTGLYGVNLPDTVFYHYCIQQNLYRYILQKNYGIRVKELNLVILWPKYNNYYKINVPLMDDVISKIVNICIEHDLGHTLLS